MVPILLRLLAHSQEDVFACGYLHLLAPGPVVEVFLVSLLQFGELLARLQQLLF